MDSTLPQTVTMDSPEDIALADKMNAARQRIVEELGKLIVGQQDVVHQVMLTLFVGGNSLIVGVPGLAKTLLIRTLAEVLDLKFNRIQFTPDLMPSDILGAEVIEEDRATGKRVIRFIRGRIFANIILADEINRTPPKTQAALLEAMQEFQVTVNGVRFDLDRPLFVLATQNPIEQEGTYPLPEAQLDRFMFNVVIDYPSAEEERRILSLTTGNAEPAVAVVASGGEIERMHAIVREVPAAENIIDFAARLVRATRPSSTARRRKKPSPAIAGCRSRRRCSSRLGGRMSPASTCQNRRRRPRVSAAMHGRRRSIFPGSRSPRRCATMCGSARRTTASIPGSSRSAPAR